MDAASSDPKSVFVRIHGKKKHLGEQVKELNQEEQKIRKYIIQNMRQTGRRVEPHENLCFRLNSKVTKHPLTDELLRFWYKRFQASEPIGRQVVDQEVEAFLSGLHKLQEDLGNEKTTLNVREQTKLDQVMSRC
jgi:hypothetical protein